MADDTQNSVLRQRAGRPRCVSFRAKPVMRTVVLQVSGINQSNQDIHIQKKPAHGSSSRSRCTNSEVTRGAPLRVLRSGTPFLVFALVSEGESARLASEEITSPTDFFSISASSLAALSTSSSIASVVLITSNIIHQMRHSQEDYFPRTHLMAPDLGNLTAKKSPNHSIAKSPSNQRYC
jgi:hypothetical protein